MHLGQSVHNHNYFLTINNMAKIEFMTYNSQRTAKYGAHLTITELSFFTAIAASIKKEL